MQQDANRRLNFRTRKTMMTAQMLYEGIDIEAEGFEFGISSLLPDGKTEILPDKNTCLAENAYPWNEMK